MVRMRMMTAAAAFVGAGVLAATAVTMAPAPAAAQEGDCVITVGRVVPLTGPLLDMGRETPWVDEHKVGPINAAGGLEVGDRQCMIEYEIFDSEGTMAGSAEAATRAILEAEVDVLMAQGTPDTTNAPSDLCERYEVPCITSNTPIEAWLFGPDGQPKEYDHTFHFFFSVPDLVANHIGMIKALPGGFNGTIGYLYPNDPDGVVFASLFDPAFAEQGWEAVDPGRFQQGLPDFSSIINQFRRNRVEVVTGVLAPPDMQNYLQQAAQAGFRPKMYIIDKGTGYPEPMRALGEFGENLLSVNFWSPAYPGASQYGGWDGAALAQAYADENPGAMYSPPLAYTDASYDVLFDALQRAGTTDRAALLAALAETDLDTVVGQVSFNDQNYSVQPLGGAQWQTDPETGELVKENVFNEVYPSVEITAEMRLYTE
ncbi:MAG: ABC transporter substrate-binding protein [Azospirillaceae bacterium]